MTLLPGREIWSIDTEWGFQSGRVDEESAWQPVVLCAVAALSGQRLHFWGTDPGIATFFSDHRNDLFVAHYAIAEIKYLMRLKAAVPTTWFDTFVAWRVQANSPGRLEGGLSHALHAHGQPHLAPAAKKELQLKILGLKFNADDAAERQDIVDYCFSDCDGALALFRLLDSEALQNKMRHWSAYLHAVARMELRGVPFDVAMFEKIRGNKEAIRNALIGEINQTCPVYRHGSFHKASLLAWCESAGVLWPTKAGKGGTSKYQPMDQDTLKEMEGRHPFIGEVRQVRKTLDSLSQRTLTVDRDLRRHFFSTSVFRTVSSRNQPKNFVFSGPKWLRYLIVPESSEHVLVYVDYTAQEIGIAAALSKDLQMRAIYEADDCHMAFAVRAGAAPAGATKSSYPEIRKRFKTVNLGVQYGQTAFGIARKLGISRDDAEALFSEHRKLFATFWNWSEDLVQGSFDRGWITTPCGWRSHVPRNSNERTWMNWPMQSTGSDIMRLTVTYLDQQNVQILAPVHDGFLLTCRRDEIGDLREAIDAACKTAIDQVIPGFPLRWDIEIHEGRFRDADGLPLWNRLQAVLGGIAGHENA